MRRPLRSTLFPYTTLFRLQHGSEYRVFSALVRQFLGTPAESEPFEAHCPLPQDLLFHVRRGPVCYGHLKWVDFLKAQWQGIHNQAQERPERLDLRMAPQIELHKPVFIEGPTLLSHFRSRQTRLPAH